MIFSLEKSPFSHYIHGQNIGKFPPRITLIAINSFSNYDSLTKIRARTKIFVIYDALCGGKNVIFL
jgi:hypothetical protein